MKALFNLIPETYFVKKLKQNTLGSIKIALLREVTGNLIIRSNYPDETITFKVSDKKDVVEIPARKFKSKEKLLGLKMCRAFGVVDKDLRYNVIQNSKQLGNPNSILFGDSVTISNDAVGLTSRVIYDWAYSIRDVGQLTATLQHNALSEEGNMNDETKVGGLRQSLFQVQYVKPNTYFPHFITVENVTPELFIHLLSCILYENRYGAQSTTVGANIKNHLLGIGVARFEQAVNSFGISKMWEEEIVTFDSVKAAIQKTMITAYGKENYKDGQQFTALIDKLWKNEKQLQKLYEQAQKDAVQFLKDVKII